MKWSTDCQNDWRHSVNYHQSLTRKRREQPEWKMLPVTAESEWCSQPLTNISLFLNQNMCDMLTASPRRPANPDDWARILGQLSFKGPFPQPVPFNCRKTKQNKIWVREIHHMLQKYFLAGMEVFLYRLHGTLMVGLGILNISVAEFSQCITLAFFSQSA